MPSSLVSATTSTIGDKTGLFNHRHQKSSTEVRANKYAAEYFGPSSAIGKSRYYPKK